MTDLTLLDLLPLSIKSDTRIKGMAAAIQWVLDQVEEKISRCVLYSDEEIIDESIMDFIAFEQRIHGYSLSKNIDQKKAFLEAAVLLRRYNATPWVLEKVFEILESNVKLWEWFEEENGTPYTQYVDFTEYDEDITPYAHDLISGYLRKSTRYYVTSGSSAGIYIPVTSLSTSYQVESCKVEKIIFEAEENIQINALIATASRNYLTETAAIN